MKKVVLFTAVAWMTILTGISPAIEADAISRKQVAQKRAMKMTSELISSILDIQLQQLEQNGLKDHESGIYREIRKMRENIDSLIHKSVIRKSKNNMNRIVELLEEAQSESPDSPEQKAKILQAREIIREVVYKLQIERQKLLKRLKIVEMTEQVKRLIQMERDVMKTTIELSESSQTKRERILLATLENQKDIHKLFMALKEMLHDVKGWGGQRARYPESDQDRQTLHSRSEASWRLCL